MTQDATFSTKTDSPVWYLAIEGKATGPFSLDQLYDRYERGEIKPDQMLTAPPLGGKWIAAQEVMRSYLKRTSTGSIQLPPRPMEVVTQSSTHSPSLQEPDPVVDLFDVLQNVRERKTVKSPVSPEHGMTGAVSGPRPKLRVPGQVWLILSISLVLGLGAWFTMTLLKRAPDVETAGQSEKNVETIKNTDSRAVSAPTTPHTPAVAPAAAPKPFTPMTTRPAFQAPSLPRPGGPAARPAVPVLPAGGGAVRIGDDDWKARDENNEPAYTDGYRSPDHPDGEADSRSGAEIAPAPPPAGPPQVDPATHEGHGSP